tara:strand:+ start:386 stop:583 length:198 start_codon:yes stop_codon:yes gene_type:complete
MTEKAPTHVLEKNKLEDFYYLFLVPLHGHYDFVDKVMEEILLPAYENYMDEIYYDRAPEWKGKSF